MNKALELLGKLSRYGLAMVTCFYLVEFISLLGAHSERAAYLAGGAIARAVIYGAVAAVWFYNARKRRTLVEARIIAGESGEQEQ